MRRGLGVGSRTVAAVAALAVAGAAANDARAAGEPYRDASRPVSERVDDLLSRMSLDDKIGQMTQVERLHASPADVASHRVGSVLSGGGSAPSPNTASAWADMYDGFQRASVATPLGIPVIYGVDAVHGHNNVAGATLFPHNIGLGATRDPELVERIGRATAREVAGTGIDWDFAPCVCVARDDRWGRTYESFGETPELPSAMTSLVAGLQGPTLGGAASVLATAKHFIGDGGTTGGVDQGNTEIAEAELRAVHLPPFREAVRRGVGSVMVSYSSWYGTKMHEQRYLISDVLKGELGFEGFVVSDWEAIDQIDYREAGGNPKDFSADEVRRAINAGIDMVMVPDDYRRFMSDLRGEVQAGRVPMSRIDDATRRILTKKFELGLFERPYTDRTLTGTVGSAAHRAIAREAVRKSLVLLKNRYDVLPLPKTAHKVFVAGKSADDAGNQSGGWTISWQGQSGPVAGATSILQGIRSAVSPGTTVTYDREGDGIDSSYKAAIAVVGETPYTEYFGDRPNGFGLDAEDQQTLSRLRASGVPVIVVLVSGRPMDIAAHLGEWDALVAAWLPGSEGAGVADVLFGDHAPTGRLPVSWPRSAAQEPINEGDGKSPLFAYGAGLRYPASQSATDMIGAAYYDEQRGTQLEGCTDDGCGQNVSHIARGDLLAYADVDFGTSSPARVLTRLASGSPSTGTIEYRLDRADGPVIARQAVADTGGWQTWTSVRTALTTPVTGRHRLYVTFSSASAADFVNLNWFRFETDAGGGISPSAWYRVTSAASGKCVDAAGWGTTNGTAVQQWACGTAQANQQWQFTATDAGHHRVTSRNAATLVWDVAGGTGATADGTPVQLWGWGGGANQQWRPIAAGNGTYTFVARHSGKCLEVPGASGADGVRLQQSTCNGSPGQAFRLTMQ